MVHFIIICMYALRTVWNIQMCRHNADLYTDWFILECVYEARLLFLPRFALPRHFIISVCLSFFPHGWVICAYSTLATWKWYWMEKLNVRTPKKPWQTNGNSHWVLENVELIKDCHQTFTSVNRKRQKSQRNFFSV